jgi:hypothetical protein
MKLTDMVFAQTNIETSSSRVWQVITDQGYAKILGTEFDKNAFIASDWKMGSKVKFMYLPDKVVATGTVVDLIKEKLIQVDYRFHRSTYTERFTLESQNTTLLSVSAGPYGSDFEAQKVVWSNWLAKVKELSENI